MMIIKYGIQKKFGYITLSIKIDLYIFLIYNTNNIFMAYQQCTNVVISLLKNTYPNHDWNEDKRTILQTVLYNIGCKALCFDDE